MAYTPPQPGQEVGPFVADSAMWKDLLGVIDWRRENNPSDNKRSSVEANAYFIADKNRDAGSLVQLTGLEEGSGNEVQAQKFASIATIQDPVWHSAIDNIYPLAQAAIIGNTVSLGRTRYATSDITLTDVSHRYAMPDPSNPTKLKSATAGIYKILGVFPTESVALVDTYEGYYNWRFKLNEDWPTGSVTASCKLVNWDGVEFASTVDVSDPLEMMRDLKQDYEGYCHHIGNTFVAYQAPCVEEWPTGPVEP